MGNVSEMRGRDCRALSPFRGDSLAVEPPANVPERTGGRDPQDPPFIRPASDGEGHPPPHPGPTTVSDAHQERPESGPVRRTEESRARRARRKAAMEVRSYPSLARCADFSVDCSGRAACDFHPWASRTANG